MARKLVVEILGDASSLDRAFRRSSASGNAFGRDMDHLGRGALVATAGFRGLGRSIAFASGAFLGGAGLAAGLKASIQGFSSFTEAMQRSVGLAGVAQSSVHGFSKEILNLSTVVGKSPQELAQGFYFIASSGIAASKAMDVLTVSAKASAAGLGETQTVADAVTSAINAYGAANLSAQKAADVLVATVREGKGEAAAFAPVIGNVAVLASQLGVSFNEVGAALAAQTRLGTDAETAATQLQRVFSSLIKVTPQSAKAFKSVGLNAAKLRDDLGKKGLLFVLEEVKRAFGDNLPALARAFGDVRAVRGVLALIGNQAASTEQIFRRLKDTSGSLKTAFDAVSKDTAQQFRRLRSSVQVAGIAIGAVFAPLAGAVADVLAKAADHVTKFFDDISQAHTVQAKLNVVIRGAEGAAKGLKTALATAVAKIDWQQVFAAARGIADGLQARLEQIDWGKVGKAVGDGIAKGISGAAGFAKALGNRFEEAFRTIDFVKLGRAAGPGLAAAVVTAFATITDPGFWIKNWDLALAVALVAFGGVVGKIAGKLAAPLVRVLGPAFERSILAVAGIVGRGSERIGLALLEGLLKIPALVARVLAPLQGVVDRVFKRLGRIGSFVVKVLGIQAAINALVGFGAKVGAILKGAFSRAWEAVEVATLKAVEKVVALLARIPTQFTVLGKKVGFENPFKGLDQKLKNEIAGLGKTAAQGGEMVGNLFGGNFVTAVASSFASLRVLINQAVTDALHGAAAVQQAADRFTAADANRAPSPTETSVPDTTHRPPRQRHGITADKRNTFFDNALARQIDRVQDAPLKAQLAKLQGIAALITARIAATKDVTRKLTLEDKLVEVTRQIKAVRGQLAQSFLDALQLNVDKASLTTNLNDDLRALLKANAAIKAQIQATGETNDLEQKLVANEQAIASIKQQRQQNAFAALQLNVDKAGLTTSLADDLAALLKANAAIKNEIKATGDTNDLEQQLLANLQSLKDVRQQQAQARNDARNAKQFKALGLTKTGEEIAPGVNALKKQLGSVSDLVTGTFLDTKKTHSVLAGVARVLKGGLGTVGREMRQKIAEILKGLDDQVKNHQALPIFKHTSTSKLTEGLGLNSEQRRLLRLRLSTVGPGGTVPGGKQPAFAPPAPVVKPAAVKAVATAARTPIAKPALAPRGPIAKLVAATVKPTGKPASVTVKAVAKPVVVAVKAVAKAASAVKPVAKPVVVAVKAVAKPATVTVKVRVKPVLVTPPTVKTAPTSRQLQTVASNPGKPKMTPEIVRATFAKYPGLLKYAKLFAFKVSPPSPKGYGSESYQRGEQGSFAPKKLAIELYGKKNRPADVAGEIVSHFLGRGIDPALSRLYQRFAKSLTPEQMRWLRFSKKEGHDTRSFAESAKLSGIPALFRGKLFGQLWPNEVHYTKAQNDIFAQVKKLLGGTAPHAPRPRLAPAASTPTVRIPRVRHPVAPAASQRELQAAPAAAGATYHIENLHINRPVGNPRELEDQLQKRTRSRANVRRGA